jgi:hypothetical protein
LTLLLGFENFAVQERLGWKLKKGGNLQQKKKKGDFFTASVGLAYSQVSSEQKFGGF